ncbi:MAG: anaerobic ribonucleoside-triphosphate reductase activating protein [bacterium]|nr:anaerobic ribonucleoside-triphosphate reductase activating protein [bacterium]
MVIGGLQKLSLVDYPGKVCSVVFTQGCMFRCRFCHNPDLVLGRVKNTLSPESVLDYVREHRNILDGVCVTGGEPTLHRDLEDFLRAIKELGLLVKLDSNGINPARLAHFVEQELLDYIAMDLKAPWDKYKSIIQVSDEVSRQRCKKTMQVIQDSGVDHEFRTTVLPQVHIEEDFVVMAGYLRPGEKYFVQNINYKTTLDETLDSSAVLDVSGIVERLSRRYPKLEITER